MTEALHSRDRNTPLAGTKTMEELLQSSVGQRRPSTILLGIFSAIALLLASIGIYGVMAYSVTQRARARHPNGPGAPRGRVLTVVIGQAMTLTGAGVAIGLVGAFALTRLLGSQLFDIKPTGPATFVVVALAAIRDCAAGAADPAIRATLVDPIVSLRSE